MFIEKLPSGNYRGGFRNPATGKKVTQTFEYEYEAETWAAESERRAKAIVEAMTQPAPAPEPAPAPMVRDAGPTIAEHGAEMIDRKAGRLTVATVRGYRSHLAGLIKSGIGQRRIGELRRSDVERWMTAQIHDGAGKATVNARLTLLTMIMRDARAELLIDHEPTAGIERLTLDIRAERVVTIAEEAKLLLACTAPLEVAAITALDAGLRWSEVYGLPADAVAGDYLVVRQVTEGSARIRHYPKGHRQRVVPMTDRLGEALLPLAQAARVRAGAEALIFTGKTGKPVHYSSWRRLLWEPTVETAGAWPLGFHALRHTYGTRLAAAGVPRSEIAKLMGHADERTTGRYIHAGDDGRRLDLVRAALTSGRTAVRLVGS